MVVATRIQVDGAQDLHHAGDDVGRQILGLDARIRNLIEGIETGGVRASDVADRLAELTDQKKRVEQELDALEQQLQALHPLEITPEQIAASVEDLRGVLDRGNINERRDLLRAFVHEIKLFPDHGELTFVPPIISTFPSSTTICQSYWCRGLDAVALQLTRTEIISLP